MPYKLPDAVLAARAPTPPAPLTAAAALARMDGCLPTYRLALASFGDELARFQMNADAAYERAEAASLMACCHAIKGVSAMVGADEMAAASCAAENALRVGAPTAAVDRSALQLAAARARSAALAWLATTPAPAPAPAADNIDASTLQTVLDQLQQQLVASNLAALSTFETVRILLERRASEQCAELAAAISQLQFSRASTLCGQLMDDSQFDEGTSVYEPPSRINCI